MILIIDNYDSFTYNLVQYIGSLNGDLEVYRNDCLTPAELQDLKPERIVISPGPGRPEQAGASVEIIRRCGKEIPILGICLGHQAIAVAYGGKIVPAPEIVHGKTSTITHSGGALFGGVPDRFTATRYHSLAADGESLPGELKVTARTGEGVIMSLEHVEYPVYGFQFHPESIVTEYGMRMIQNFLEV